MGYKKSFNEIVIKEVRPKLYDIVEQVYKQKKGLMMNGIKAFNSSASFVEGAVVDAACYLLITTDRQSAEFEYELHKVKELINYAAEFKTNTFGILGQLTGLQRLKEYGLLNELIDDELFEKLKISLDWRMFVDQDNFSLKNGLPFNYYSVAFRVAKLREILGFEKEIFSNKFLVIFMEHIRKNSGEYGFMDDTMGGGRFDRYSTVIPAELCSQISNLGLEVPEELRSMLRKCCNIYLQLADEKGNGFSYGRSLGTHGDAGVVEVLPLAAKLGLLSEEEKMIAYNYGIRVIRKTVDFWFDTEMNSINIWTKGRRVDQYRNINRILEVNIDVLMKVIEANEEWNKANYKDKLPSDEYSGVIHKLPEFSLFRFIKGDYDRALVIVRDRNHVFSIPLISGGKNHYATTPYLPIPYETQFIEGTPDEVRPLMVPKLILEDESEVMPISFIKEIVTTEEHGEYLILLKQDNLCIIKEIEPVQSEGIKSNTRYTFRPGTIIREDNFDLQNDIKVKEIVLEFDTFSESPVLKDNKVQFKTGDIYEIEVEGLEHCTIKEVCHNEKYFTPNGPIKYAIEWKRKNIDKGNNIKLRWMIRYY